jgi:serine/threonine-protein kinase
MPEQQQICFDDRRLQDFIDERVDETVEAEVLDHIGSCSKCQAAMERLSARQDVWSDIKNNLDEDRLNTIGCETQDLHEDLSRDMTFIKDFLAPTDDPTKIGRLGSYEVCGIIGRGSAGIVVKALDTRLHRFVAIKILAPVYSSNGSARRRFEREGRSIASVQDDHIIPVYTVDEYKGNPYIVMQYMPDGSLLQRIEKVGPMDSEEVVCIAMQVAKGLAAAHARGIVHRDVKPANVLLAGGIARAMVTDFGLARVVDEATMTRSGAISGTPQFMSPEQAKGESLDQRSDLFSLGSVMYAACTGRSPFRSETVFGVIKRVCESEPRPIREINPKIDEWLEQFIHKLHAKDPDDRFESSTQVAELLFEELTHMQSPTLVDRPIRTWAPAKPKQKPNYGRLGIIATSIAVIGLLIGGWQMGFGKNFANGNGWMGLGSFFQTQDQDKELPRFENSRVATMDVKDNGKLVLRTNLGRLSVKTHDQPQVKMTLTHTVEAENEEAAKRHFQSLNMTYTDDHKDVEGMELKNGRDAIVIAEFVDRNLSNREIEDSDDLETLKEKLLLSKMNTYRDADFELLVPESFNLDLETDAGPISITTIDGDVSLRTRGGSIEAMDITGTTQLFTSGGHINVGNVESNATLNTNGGHIKIENVEGNLVAKTSGGHVDVGEVEGTSELYTEGGGITVARGEGTINATTKGGAITISRAEEACELSASIGGIQVFFVGQPSEDSKLSTASGNIKVGMSQDTAFRIDTTTGNGKVIGPFIEGSPQAFEKTINEGAFRLKAVTGSGNIRFFYLDDSVDGRISHPFPEDEADYDLFDTAFQLHKDGKLDQAIKAYEEAVENEVKAAVATFNMGCVWAEKGDADKAFEALNESINMGFKDLDQFEFDGDLEPLRDDTRYQDLIDRIKKGSQLPDLLVRGLGQVNSGQYEIAIEALQSAMTLDPENIDIVFHLGYAHHMVGDIDIALPLHKKAAESDDYAQLGNYNTACAYSLLENSEEALKYLERAIDAGWNEINHMEQDSDLDNIRDEDRFKELMKRAESDDAEDCSHVADRQNCEGECNEKQTVRKSVTSVYRFLVN